MASDVFPYTKLRVASEEKSITLNERPVFRFIRSVENNWERVLFIVWKSIVSLVREPIFSKLLQTIDQFGGRKSKY